MKTDLCFSEKNKDGVVWMEAENLRFPHGFTTRFGGVSSGIYASLNLGEHRGDDDLCVAENYRRLCAALDFPVERLVFSRQVHRADIRYVTPEDCHELFAPVPYEADGLITDTPNLPLVIFTADCIPILLSDPVRGAIGALHAGWRGTVADIAGAGVRAMVSKFGCRPEDIQAAIGPGISYCCFETGREVPEAILSLLGDSGRGFFTSKGEKYMVDLKAVNRRLLENAGVLPAHIAVSPECTMCSHDKYWSHRYTKGQRGSQASLIMIKEA